MALNDKFCAPADLTWSAVSWRTKPIKQLPPYQNSYELFEVEKLLRTLPPLLTYTEIVGFKQQLSLVAKEQAILLHAGDCAEIIKPPVETAAYVNDFYGFLIEAAQQLEENIGKPVVTLGRIAGQLAKPRSSNLEHGHKDLPSYRGDIINSIECTTAARAADAKRMLSAYNYSVDVIRHLRDLSTTKRKHVYTSHEALLLPYEEGLVRFNEDIGEFYASTAHMLWIGERTRQHDHAHVEFCRGLSNPIGIKISRHVDVHELLIVVKSLNPSNEAGKIILITRFGAAHIEKFLPKIIKELTKAGQNIIWLCDPMHGNGCVVHGQKTRYLDSIKSETKSFFDIHRGLGTYAAGVHFEATYENVAECIDDKAVRSIEEVKAGYKSYCDPRLNNIQTRAYMDFLIRLIKTKQT